MWKFYCFLIDLWLNKNALYIQVMQSIASTADGKVRRTDHARSLSSAMKKSKQNKKANLLKYYLAYIVYIALQDKLLFLL